jgi:phosphotriesterase-related protein
MNSKKAGSSETLKLITVNGEIDCNSLDIISPHEHVFIDIRNQFTEFEEITQRKLSEQRITIENLGVLSRNPYALKDNLFMDDEELAAQEILCFKKAGGDALVDATTIGIGRDPVALKKISRTTGLAIIAGCGYYTEDTHPEKLRVTSVEKIAEEMINDIVIGISGTNIKAGVIGEIGTSQPIGEIEKKVLAAAAIAQKETGLGVLVHTYPWGHTGLDILEIFKKNKAAIDKVCICHVDVEIDNIYCEKIMESGAFIEFDDFGKEFFIARRDGVFAGGVFARDIERVKAIKRFIDKGYVKNILISCDVCLKTLLHRYGGWGYDHILSNILTMMSGESIGKEDIDIIIRENPKRFLGV